MSNERLPIVFVNALSARQGGGQTYLRNLFDYTAAGLGATIYYMAPMSFEYSKRHKFITRIVSNKVLENPFIRTVWEKYYLPKLLRKLKVDILFCPGGVISTKVPVGCKTATMFRNMIPFDMEQRKRYPLSYMKFRNWVLHREMLDSMIGADLVVFISDYAKKLIEKNAGNKLKKGVVIRHGVSENYRVNNDKNSQTSPSIQESEYLLYVSSIDKYKAQLEVVKGYAILKSSYPVKEKLLLVGPVNNQGYAKLVREEVTRHGLTDDIIMRGSVSYSELPSLYRNAKVNIYASESENCPNILLEALAAGRPALVSNCPPMPEFAGNAVIYFDPRSPEDFAAKLIGMLSDKKQLEELAGKAEDRSKLFDWKETAKQTWHEILQLYSQ